VVLHKQIPYVLLQLAEVIQLLLWTAQLIQPLLVAVVEKIQLELLEDLVVVVKVLEIQVDQELHVKVMLVVMLLVPCQQTLELVVVVKVQQVVIQLLQIHQELVEQV
tara:strand:+ start:88 stop:408 length:321 start_codon:yes stop_codon:yes gene_type:complete